MSRAGADVKARDRWDNTALDAAPVGSASETLLLAAGSKRTPERRGTNARASAVAAFARADSKDLFVVDWRDVDLVERIGGGSFGTARRPSRTLEETVFDHFCGVGMLASSPPRT